jgi:hypothetical protein
MTKLYKSLTLAVVSVCIVSSTEAAMTSRVFEVLHHHFGGSYDAGVDAVAPTMAGAQTRTTRPSVITTDLSKIAVRRPVVSRR